MPRESHDSTDPRLHFSYWSDPLCIWAYVAHSKLEQLLASGEQALQVAYRIVPVFGSVQWRVTEGPWSAGGLEGRVLATRRIAHEHDCPEVSGECWVQDTPASSWAASLAIKAVCACERDDLSAPGSCGAYLEKLRARFFVDNQNIARRDVQLEVAEGMGLPRAPIEAQLDNGAALAALWEDHNEKERLHIQGSPTYVFDGGRAMLYGNFDYGVLQATVHQLVTGSRAAGTAC